MTPGSTICKKIQYEFKWRRTNQDAYNVSDAYAIEQKKKPRSEEHTSNSSHTVISYAVFCLKKKKKDKEKTKKKKKKTNKQDYKQHSTYKTKY